MARAAIDAIVAHARHAAPVECCGILIGAGANILEAIAAPNLSEDPNRFLLDPRTHFEALRGARARGLAVIGFYHSHPHSPAQPSPTDVAEAFDGETIHLIVSLEESAASFGLFRMRRGEFERVAYELMG